jgi:hypothetical protein
MIILADAREGTSICVYGWGTSFGTHKHVTVDRVTQTMLVTSDGRRFNRTTGDSVPRSSCWGGEIASMECQGMGKVATDE